MHLAQNHQEWTKHNGKVLRIDGLRYRLKVSTHRTIYPYEADVISVDLVPASKNSKRYREVKAILGDDWTTDVLSSLPEFTCKVLRIAQATS